MTSYGSVSELRALKLLRTLFGEVINPSEKQYGTLCGSDMNEWVKLASRCDGVVFMGFDDGAISSGVDKEVSAVMGQGKPAFRISPSNGALEPVENWPGNAHVLSLEHTRSRVRGFLNQRSRDGKPGLPTRPNTGNLNWLNPSKGLKL